MAASIRGKEPAESGTASNDLDYDDATVVATDLADFKIPHPSGAKPSEVGAASPTPAPEEGYDPKNLSAKEAQAEDGPGAESSSKATRQNPAIPAAAKPARTTPAIVKRNPGAAPGATVETPKIVRDELSTKMAAPTPPPPESSSESDPKSTPQVDAPANDSQENAGGWRMIHWIMAFVVLNLIGGGVMLLLGVGSSTEEIVEAPPPPVETNKADDSVGNLIKKADEKFVKGELIGDGGALSLLVAARVASPDDDRVALRLGPLADKFEELGQAAYEAGDLVEAAGHFKNSLEADPERQAVASILAAIETDLATAEANRK